MNVPDQRHQLIADIMKIRFLTLDAPSGISAQIGPCLFIDAVTAEQLDLSSFDLIGDSVDQGIWSVVSLIAVLSVNFGLLNMLPVPALDGSRFLFLVIEAVRGIPVSQDKETLVNLLGMMALFALMIYVTYNDILNIVN